MFSFLKTLSKKRQSNADNIDVQSDELKKFNLSGNIRDNIDRLTNIMNNSGDIQSREFNLSGNYQH